MRIVRMPAGSRRYFTGNELSGYMDGIRYTPPGKRQKKRKRKKPKEEVQRVVVSVEEAIEAQRRAIESSKSLTKQEQRNATDH
jgi:hypothetical protein